MFGKIFSSKQNINNTFRYSMIHNENANDCKTINSYCTLVKIKIQQIFKTTLMIIIINLNLCCQGMSSVFQVTTVAVGLKKLLD